MKFSSVCGSKDARTSATWKEKPEQAQAPPDAERKVQLPSTLLQTELNNSEENLSNSAVLV